MNDLTQYAEPVARALRGEPNHELSKPGKELRYGSRGSLAFDLEKATVYDHEAGEGWGLLDFIRHETGESNPLAWMESQGIKTANERVAPKPRRQMVATYDYRDAAGELVYQVVRYEPKDFRQRRPDPTKRGGWNWSIKGVEPLPYRLPDLLNKPEAPVFIVEGEKDADALAALGFIATCNSGGANKWPEALGRYFSGRRVVILPDNDQTGRDHAQTVAALLTRAGAAGVKVLELPGLPPKGDVSDWLKAGGNRDQLRELAGAAPLWEPQTLPAVGNDNAAPVVDVHNAPVVPFMSWPHTGEKGRPLNTIPNLAHLLQHYGFTVRYDVIRKDLVIRYPGQAGTVDNQRQAAVNTVLSLCALNNLPKTEAPAFLLSVGDQEPVNPVMDWILSRPWDGQTRLPALVDTLQTRPDYDRGLLALLLRRWLISAVAAAAKPSGFRSKGVLTLQGAQSLGKTAWFMALVPEAQRDLLKVDAVIDTRDKDTITSAVSHWLVELGELDGTFRKSDIARLKGFISADFDQFRRPYARAEEKYPRKTVFFASVNDSAFLVDTTGNTRWWTVPVVHIDYEHTIDMQQLWAEIYALHQSGEPWWLSRDEEARLEQANDRHRQVDPIEELILRNYDPTGTGHRRALTATELLLEIGIDRPTNGQCQKAGKIMAAVFGEAKRQKGRTVYPVPEPLQARPY